MRRIARMLAYLEPALENLPQLLRLCVAWILNLQVASLGYNLFGSEWPLGVPPTGVTPPLLDLGHFSGKQVVFHAGFDSRIHHVFRSHLGNMVLTTMYVLLRELLTESQ